MATTHAPTPFDLLSVHEAAVIRGCSPDRLKKERLAGVGMAYVKDGASIRYMRRDVEKFIQSLPRIIPIKKEAS